MDTAEAVSSLVNSALLGSSKGFLPLEDYLKICFFCLSTNLVAGVSLPGKFEGGI